MASSKTTRLSGQRFNSARRNLIKSAGIVTISQAFGETSAPAKKPRDADGVLLWPTWRGPQWEGSSSEGQPPIRWNASENVGWNVSLPGRGNGSPIVVGDQLILLTAVENPETDGRHRFLAMAFDRRTGSESWRTVLTEKTPHEPGHTSNTFASSSPVSDGDRIYVSLGSFGVYALSLDGELLWKRHFGTLKTRRGYGEGVSPAVHDGVIVIPFDQEGPSFVIALDAATGQTIWRTRRDEPTTWATPLIARFGDRIQVVLSGHHRVESYDLNNGRSLWRCGPMSTNPIPTPVRYRDDVIVTTGYQGYVMHSISLAAKGDVNEGHPAMTWTQRQAAPYVASPLVLDDFVYFVKSLTGLLICCDAATGTITAPPLRLPKINSVYASPVAANGNIYVTGRNGTTVVLKAGRQPEVIAVNPLDAAIDASAAIANDAIFLRGKQSLYCLVNSES